MYRVHEWLGIVTGAFLVVIGLTGSIIVFDGEIDRWLHPGLLEVSPLAGTQPVDAQVAAATRAAPAGGKLDGIYQPEDERAATAVYFETPDHDHALVSVDPYTASVLGTRSGRSDLVSFIYSLHYTLGVRPWGDLLVAVIGFTFLASGFSGLWVIRHSLGLTLKRRVRTAQGSKRLWSDLHKFVGLVTVAFHVMFAVSGAYMMLYAFSPDYLSGQREAEERRLAAYRPVVTLSHDRVLESARAALPGFQPKGIGLPHFPREPIRVYGRIEGTSAIWGEYSSSVEIDASGAVHKVHDIRTAPLLDRYETVLYQLHFGQYGGNAVRILYVVLGLMPGVLAVSGFVLWWKRRRRAAAWAGREGAAGPGHAPGRVADPAPVRPAVFARADQEVG